MLRLIGILRPLVCLTGSARAVGVAERGSKPILTNGMTLEQYIRSGLDDEASLGTLHSGFSYKLRPDYFNPETEETIYPPNDGARDGIVVERILSVGKIIDRFGHDGGRYFGEDSAPYEDRAMPLDGYSTPYNRYKVIREFTVDEAEIAPWFGFQGGGIQYKSQDAVAKLLEDGYIELVTDINPP